MTDEVKNTGAGSVYSETGVEKLLKAKRVNGMPCVQVNGTNSEEGGSLIHDRLGPPAKMIDN